MKRKTILVVVSNFYRMRTDSPHWAKEATASVADSWLLSKDPVEAWMTPGLKENEKEKLIVKSALPHRPVLAWIGLLTEADRRYQTQIYRSFVSDMERWVKAMIYPEAYGP